MTNHDWHNCSLGTDDNTSVNGFHSLVNGCLSAVRQNEQCLFHDSLYLSRYMYCIVISDLKYCIVVFHFTTMMFMGTVDLLVQYSKAPYSFLQSKFTCYMYNYLPIIL